MENPNGQYVVVLGATGKAGSQVIQYLSDRKIHSKAITRDIAKAREMPYVRWMEADINDTRQLPGILKGGQQLFLNSGIMQTMVRVQRDIIDAAKESGITYILKLSTPAASQHSKDPVGEWHWQAEEHLKASGIRWNVLHPQSFMQNWLGDFPATVKSERKIYSTAGDGRKAFIDTRDIGRVAASLFEDPKEWINRILPLSGGELVSFYDVAHAFTEAIGEKVTYVLQTPEEAVIRLKKAGIPDYLIRVTLAMDANQKAGGAERSLTGNVERITGVKPFTVSGFAKKYIASSIH